MSRVSRRFHGVGLVLACPLLLLALGLGAVATWEARPLPACLPSGLDPLHPLQKCRRAPRPLGPSASSDPTSLPPVRQVEQGSVSGVPDFDAAGSAAGLALALYLASRGLGWIAEALLRRRARTALPLGGPARRTNA